ncbi:MAG: TetR/AcrR family transcriptional regulator [Solirubrobacterales bacterium]
MVDPPSPHRPDGRGGQLPRGRHTIAREEVLESQHGRLLSAFVTVAAERGYDAVTISDIVANAGTSKRTFYEHFEDKEDCLVQAFDLAQSFLVDGVLAKINEPADPIGRIAIGIRAYIEALVAIPDFTKLFLHESMSAGSRLADRWIAAAELFADVIAAQRDASRVENPELPPLGRLQALTVILGINELICVTIYREGIEAVPALTNDLVELATTLLTATENRY